MKKIITFAIIAIVIIIGFFVVREVLSYKSIGFDLKDSDYTVSIFNTDKKKVSELTKSQSIQLKEGDYYYDINGDKFAQETVDFAVRESRNITIDPDYSLTYLRDKAADATPNIVTLISNRYASLINKYTLEDFTLLKKGEWGIGYLVEKVDRRIADPNIYRFIVHKDKDVWTISATPALTITKSTYPSIPPSVIDQVNLALPKS